MKNIIVRIVEFLIVMVGLVTWHLVGRVEPSFGWFLSQPVVVLTEISVVVGYGIYTIIHIVKEYKILLKS